jgi:hypothetical protein
VRLRVTFKEIKSMRIYQLCKHVIFVATVATVVAAESGWFKAGSNSDDYEMGIDTHVAYTGTSSGYIKSSKPEPKGFGTYMQMFDATEYRGKRLRLSAYIKSDSIQKWAGMWMRVDRDQKPVAFDNMGDRAIKGTQAWTRHEIVLDVDPKATQIAFGILLEGKGTAWIDDAVFDVVSEQVPVTGKGPRTPRNLDFEGDQENK